MCHIFECDCHSNTIMKVDVVKKQTSVITSVLLQDSVLYTALTLLVVQHHLV